MSPHQVGLTCQPSSLFDTKGCTQGGYPSYTVNASSVAQIQLAVNFARNAGIRFVIKNTGHDFLGKSSGAGSLSVWMHGLKDMEFIPFYDGSSWSGAAIKAGAGVQGFELYDFAYRNNVTTVGGIYVTVGVFGGWFQGGGHSPLSPLFGMGADQVLAIDLVTSDGHFVTASEEKNADLFWALRGGGAGTYGVVVSVTIKAHASIPASTANWSFSYPSDVTEDTFKLAVQGWLSYFPRYADLGLYSTSTSSPAPTAASRSS
jgi:FAD/FMN-containing dehydrogenase